MQKIYSHLDQFCEKPNGYKLYQELLNSQNLTDFWDLWCFVAYFSRKQTLANIAPEFLLAIGESFYTTWNNPGILSIDQRTLSSKRVHLDMLNLDKQLRTLARQEPANTEAIWALFSLQINKPRNSQIPTLKDEEVQLYSMLLNTAIARTDLPPGQLARAHILLGYLPVIQKLIDKSMDLSQLVLASKECFVALKQAAAQGDDWCQFMLGEALANPICRMIHQEGSSYLSWLEKAANQGNFRAQVAIATIVAPGLKSEPNWTPEMTMAYTNLQKATKQGHPFACLFLANYEVSCDQSITEKIKGLWFKAALQGLLSAQIRLGDYFKKQGDLKHAAIWYQRAAEHNDFEGIFKLAKIYESGQDEFHNPARAVELYSKVLDLSKHKFTLDYCSLSFLDSRPNREIVAKAAHALVTRMPQAIDNTEAPGEKRKSTMTAQDEPGSARLRITGTDEILLSEETSTAVSVIDRAPDELSYITVKEEATEDEISICRPR